jgi:hypothetical protein
MIVLLTVCWQTPTELAWQILVPIACRVLYQINLRNTASRWLSLYEYITMLRGPLNVKNVTILHLRKFLLFYSHLYQHQKVTSNSFKTEFLRYQLNSTRNAVFTQLSQLYPTTPNRSSRQTVYGVPVIPSILCDECSTMTPLRGSTWPILHTVGTQNRSELLTRIMAPTVVLEQE